MAIKMGEFLPKGSRVIVTRIRQYGWDEDWEESEDYEEYARYEGQEGIVVKDIKIVNEDYTVRVSYQQHSDISLRSIKSLFPNELDIVSRQYEDWWDLWTREVNIHT
jgi:hypothetical protein